MVGSLSRTRLTVTECNKHSSLVWYRLWKVLKAQAPGLGSFLEWIYLVESWNPNWWNKWIFENCFTYILPKFDLLHRPRLSDWCSDILHDDTQSSATQRDIKMWHSAWQYLLRILSVVKLTDINGECCRNWVQLCRVQGILTEGKGLVQLTSTLRQLVLYQS